VTAAWTIDVDLLLALAAKLGLALVLVLFNGFFVAAELALVKIREAQLDALVARGRRAARVARTLKANMNTAISATQLGVTVASLALGRFVEPVAEAAAEPLLARLGLAQHHWLLEGVSWLAFLTTTFVLIIAGEMVPKAIAIRQTESVALGLSIPLQLFLRATHPLIWAIDTTAAWLLRLLGIEGGHGEGAHSEEELRLLFLAGGSSPVGGGAGAGADMRRELMLNALDLRRRVVAEVMRPRREITVFSTQDTIAECLDIAERTRYSRFPLCDHGNLDRTLGVVHVKDLWAQRQQAQTGADLRSVARPLIYLPETAHLDRLLQRFLDRKLHCALVVDEYGGTTGMVTLENVLEELVGQIQDEFDHEKPRIVARGDSEWELDGTLPLFELEELVGQSLEAPEITTVSGWITRQLEGFPRRLDRVPVGGFDLVVEELDGLRVARLRLIRRRPAEANVP
jgi:CBS domain containing-hemolysin-like protein